MFTEKEVLDLLKNEAKVPVSVATNVGYFMPVFDIKKTINSVEFQGYIINDENTALSASDMPSDPVRAIAYVNMRLDSQHRGDDVKYRMARDLRDRYGWLEDVNYGGVLNKVHNLRFGEGESSV